jgi:hypothetical protein
MEKYICICGRAFAKPNSFNAHKSQCKVHLKDKYGNLDNYYLSNKKRAENIGKSHRKRALEKKEENLQRWVSEEHKCEKCGKIMTEYYGSGRFCSVSCKNSRIKKPHDDIDLSLYTHKCSFCERVFKTQRGLNAHLGHTHKIAYKDTFKVKINNEELDITYKELDILRQNHNNKCDICGQEEVCNTQPHKKKTPNALCVDHDHKTLKFRGFLCNSCNRKLAWYEKERKNIENYLKI